MTGGLGRPVVLRARQDSRRGVRTRLLVALVVLTGALACGTGAPDPEADRQAILDLGDRAVAALNEGDIDGFLALWTDDAILMPPAEGTQLGKDRIRGGIEAFYRNWTVDMRTRVGDVWIAGDMAVVHGTNIGAVRHRREPRINAFDRKFVWVLERQPDGSWAIALEINNRNGSGPPATPD